MSTLLTGTELVGGVGEGELLWADIGLSFGGGVNPLDSTVIDHTHPLYKQKMAGKVCIKNHLTSQGGLCRECSLLGLFY